VLTRSIATTLKPSIALRLISHTRYLLLVQACGVFRFIIAGSSKIMGALECPTWASLFLLAKQQLIVLVNTIFVINIFNVILYSVAHYIALSNFRTSDNTLVFLAQRPSH
jgi:hypothetical protein